MESLKLKKQTHEKIELLEYVKEFNNALSAYLDEVRVGNLNEKSHSGYLD